MKWTIDHHVISSLSVNQANIIWPWGVETADSSAFYSLDRLVGYRYSILSEHYYSNNRDNSAQVTVQMKDGHFLLTTHDQIIYDSLITRAARLTPLEPIRLMDFVMRYRFKKDCLLFALINNQRIEHTDSNIYHQHQTDRVFLQGRGFNINIRISNVIMPSQFACYMYVRDAKNEWVVHIRLLPRKWDKEVIKLCNFWYRTRPLPQFISQPLLRLPSIRRSLWYRGERRPYKNKIAKLINPAAYPLALIRPNEPLEIASECEIHNE